MTPASLFKQARATGRLWNTALMVLDAGIVIIATFAAYYARFEGFVPPNFAEWIAPLMAVSIFVYGALTAAAGQYRLVLRYVGLDSLVKLSGAAGLGFAILLALDLLMPLQVAMRPVPVGVLFIQAVLVFLGTSAVRLAARVLAHMRTVAPGGGRRALIVGAGRAGSLILQEIRSRADLDLSVVGFVDDATILRGKSINGVTVLGSSDDLAALVERYDIDEIIVAMPSAPRELVRRILNTAADAQTETRVMPQLVVGRDSVSLRDLRTVDVEDLLGREPTPIDVEQVRDTIAGKVVAVTGVAGSIGSELCRQIVALDPAKLVLMDIDESRLYELWLEMESGHPGVSVMALCDIRDAAAVDRILGAHRPALVLHAAAYKHVPLMEIAPCEAVKTNVQGTLNVIEACERLGVERFVLISTDKAVAPVNVMGLTKALAERVMLDAARRGLNAVAVRFGNVLASRGSVVPIFEEQLRHGGPVTVTDPEVTRYFMTIPEASRLVLQAQAIGQAGDIFVLEMGEPVRIVDLARKMIALSGVPADITFVGLRPGEKLHESLLNETESLIPSERPGILRVDRVSRPESDFREHIDSLVQCAFADSLDGLNEQIQRLEPGFQGAPDVRDATRSA